MDANHCEEIANIQSSSYIIKTLKGWRFNGDKWHVIKKQVKKSLKILMNTVRQRVKNIFDVKTSVKIS